VTSSLAVFEVAIGPIGIKSTHLIKSCLKSERENMEIKEIFT